EVRRRLEGEVLAVERRVLDGGRGRSRRSAWSAAWSEDNRKLTRPPLGGDPHVLGGSGSGHTVQVDVVRIAQRTEYPVTRLDAVGREVREAVRPGIEEIVMIDVAGLADDPSAVHAECLGRVASNHGVQPFGLAIRPGEHALLETEQHGARDQGK